MCVIEEGEGECGGCFGRERERLRGGYGDSDSHFGGFGLDFLR